MIWAIHTTEVLTPFTISNQDQAYYVVSEGSCLILISLGSWCTYDWKVRVMYACPVALILK